MGHRVAAPGGQLRRGRRAGAFRTAAARHQGGAVIAADQMPAAELPRPRTLLVGTVFAIVACGMFFAGVFGIYLKLRNEALASGGKWLAPNQISLVPGGMMMVTSAMSVVTMAWAVQAIRNDDRKNAYIALGITLLFGVANLNQQVFYYNDMKLKVQARQRRPADLRHHRCACRHADRRHGLRRTRGVPRTRRAIHEPAIRRHPSGLLLLDRDDAHVHVHLLRDLRHQVGIMLTTGFKLFFGFFLAAATAAVLFGYTSGGSHLGPLTAGYKGAVGNQAGYTILLSAGSARPHARRHHRSSFRDADATAQAQLLGVDSCPRRRPVGASYWPLTAALAAGAIVIGLVLSSADLRRRTRSCSASSSSNG